MEKKINSNASSQRRAASKVSGAPRYSKDHRENPGQAKTEGRPKAPGGSKPGNRPERGTVSRGAVFDGGKKVNSRSPEREPLQTAEQEEVLSQGDVVAGRNAVIEALRSERTVDTIFLAEPDSGNAGASGVVGKIRSLARDAGAVVKTATREKLNQMAGNVHHQGVVAICSCADYAEVADILAEAVRKGTPPFLLIADEIEDPHNLGAIIRTAEACGADGLILPKRRSASLNTTVYKTSAGAASVLKVARVSNLVSCVKELKQQNIWIFGGDTEGTSWDKLDFSIPCALVIGSEGKGISRLLREECDFFSTLPMQGQINSLNASVAAGILMYEVVRQRLSK